MQGLIKSSDTSLNASPQPKSPAIQSIQQQNHMSPSRAAKLPTQLAEKQQNEAAELALLKQQQEAEERARKEQQQQQEELSQQNLSLNDSNCSNAAAISSSAVSELSQSQSMDAADVPQPPPPQPIVKEDPTTLMVPTESTEEETPAEDAASSRGGSTERSESCIKEVPMSGDRNRFSRSKSPKARWHNEDAAEAEPMESAPVENNMIVDGEPAEAVAAVLPTPDSTPGDDEPAVASPVKEEAPEETNKSILNNTTESELTKTPDEQPHKVQRKRKWLSNDQAAANLLSSKKQLTISSDTLKSYLPTTPTIKDDEAVSAAEEPAEAAPNNRRVIDSNMETANAVEEEPKQSTRTVILEVNSFDFSFSNSFIYWINLARFYNRMRLLDSY